MHSLINYENMYAAVLHQNRIMKLSVSECGHVIYCLCPRLITLPSSVSILDMANNNKKAIHVFQGKDCDCFDLPWLYIELRIKLDVKWGNSGV